MSDDFEVDDIIGNLSKQKKKIKSGSKGKRVERELVAELNQRFLVLINQNPSWGMFSRSVGSGNRWGQKVTLSEAGRQTFSGDIACPTNFKWVLESKGGYNDIDLNASFGKGHREIDGFINQVSDDANRSGRKPMLLWKKDRKPRLAFIRCSDVPLEFHNSRDYFMKYKDWYVYNFDEVLQLPDDFFFENRLATC